MKIGAHVSIAGGIHKAVDNAKDLGCEVFQVFTKNQNQWREKQYESAEIEQFRSKLAKSDIDNSGLTSHDSYLINLCAPDKENLKKSGSAFVAEINR